jgi:hypothetical protein
MMVHEEKTKGGYDLKEGTISYDCREDDGMYDANRQNMY